VKKSVLDLRFVKKHQLGTLLVLVNMGEQGQIAKTSLQTLVRYAELLIPDRCDARIIMLSAGRHLHNATVYMEMIPELTQTVQAKGIKIHVMVKLALSFLPVSKADVHADIANISIQTAAKKSVQKQDLNAKTRGVKE